MLQKFMEKCQQVSFQVLSCFAIGLGFEEDFFTKVQISRLPYSSFIVNMLESTQL